MRKVMLLLKSHHSRPHCRRQRQQLLMLKTLRPVVRLIIASVHRRRQHCEFLKEIFKKKMLVARISDGRIQISDGVLFLKKKKKKFNDDWE